MLWELEATALEYDGDDHRQVKQHFADNLREERFEDHGLLVARVGRPDMGRGRPQTIERLRRTSGRRSG